MLEQTGVAAGGREHELVASDAVFPDPFPQAIPEATADGHEPFGGWRLRGGEPQRAAEVGRFQPVGDLDLARSAVALDLLAHVDARLPVAQLQFKWHDCIPFTLPHAGLERDLEQGAPTSRGLLRGAAPRLASGMEEAASIMRLGWSGPSTSTTRRSILGGLTRLHGSMGMSSSSSAWSSTILRLT